MHTIPRKPGRSLSNNIPMYVLTLVAIADTFGGLLQNILSMSLILRTGIVLFLLIHILTASSIKQDTRLLWVLLILYLLARVMLNYFALLDPNVLSLEIGSNLRLLYFPLLFTYLSSKIINGIIDHNDLHRLILVYGWLILASLFIGHISGLGGVIGGRGIDMDGGKGFMIGANEVGLMLLLTAPFIGADIVRRLRNAWLGSLTQILIYTLAGIHVFTKSSLIAIFTTLFSTYQTLIKRSATSKLLARLLAVTAITYLIFFIYDNIELIEKFVMSSFFSALLDDSLLSFLFRGRQDYISAIYPQLINHDLNWLILLFGSGEHFIREISVGPLMLDPGDGTTFEMDFFDLIATNGIIGVLLFSLVLLTTLDKVRPYSIPIDIRLIVIAILGHSFMAGHVFFSPQVTTLLTLILLYYSRKRII